LYGPSNEDGTTTNAHKGNGVGDNGGVLKHSPLSAKSAHHVNGDKGISAFKENCVEKLKAVDVYITDYRDNKVVHNQQRHKQGTQWFLNNMNGEVKFVGGDRSSITPQEVLFIVIEYVDASSQFCIKWLSNQISSEVKA